jgi:uncharacterized protein (TIGR02594 family)
MSSKPELAWMKYGKSHLGMHEIKHAFILADWQADLKCSWLGNNPAWCGIYCAKVLKECGINYPKEFYRALEWKKGGAKLSKPAYGCIAIKTRKGGGHVCFVVGKLADGRLVCLGGNQSNQVCYAIYRTADFDEFRWYGRTANPAPHRFELETIKYTSSLKLQVTES